MFWNKYPYTDFSQINLDWLIRHIGGILKAWKESGGFLPKIRAGGENKVLSVKDGRPVWGTAPAGSAEVVNVTKVDPSDEYSPFMLDRTWNEIKTFVDNGIPVIIHEDFSSGIGSDYYISIGLLYSIAGGETYSVSCALDAEGWYGIRMFYADTPDDYPQTT